MALATLLKALLALDPIILTVATKQSGPSV
jgi:hypothetical protein